MAETSFSLPVYRTWPDKPYDVVGSLRFENPNQNWDDGVIRAAVGEAKAQHGDAIIIRHGSESGVSGNVGTTEDPMVWSQSQTTALVIKWKSKEVLAAEAEAERMLKANFQEKNPQASKNGSLVDSAIKYLEWTGLTPDSPAMASKLKEILTEIQKPSGEVLNGKWLCHCRYKKGHLTSSDSGEFWGIGQVTLKDDVLTVISTSGPEMNFSGTFEKGRLTGKMGIFSLSINSDGVASQEKISLSGQGQIADGTFQASLIFTR